MSEEQDRVKEHSHIEQALSQCGYPQWSIDKVVEDREQPKQQKSSDPNKEKSKGLVVLPYVEGLSEKASRVFKKHGFATSLKPHRTIRNTVVHPKDKRDPLQTAEAVYEIPCDSCNKTYIGETGRLLSKRVEEHKTETDKVTARSFTRSKSTSSTAEIYKSAIAEHAATQNHVIGFDKASVIDQETNKTTRWLKEAIWIRSRGNATINKDEGGYKLDNIYDQLIKRQPIPPSVTSSRSSDVTKVADNN